MLDSDTVTFTELNRKPRLNQENPLLTGWKTRHGIPPFDQIREHHYLPAFEQGIREREAEIEAILNNPDTPDFANTIEALEKTGELLNRTQLIFFNLSSAHTSEALQTIHQKVSPLLSRHQTGVYTNAALYGRVQAVSDSDEGRRLTGEKASLLKETLNLFVRSGAALNEAGKQEIREINEALAELFPKFSQNVLKDTNIFELWIVDENDLKGLPESVKNAARNEAISRDKDEGWLFTISRSSITPFLQYADNRELREKIYNAYINNCNNNNAHNNKKIAEQIASLRLRKALLLGYKNYAEYTLDDRMAKSPDNVTRLLDRLWEGARKKVRKEAEDIQNQVLHKGENFSIKPWDWWYYTEKLRAEQFDFDENSLRPYFLLENVRDAAFMVANRLFGLEFIPLTDFPRYHPDVQAFEVREADNSLTGIFLADYFMRPSKKGGAWMSEYRSQKKLAGETRPIIVNCCNFPTGNPCLLGLDEVRTLFHEFGHALHGLLSDTTYASLSGTSVKRDFVELPSQIMENWALEPEVLKGYAIHYQTGEVIPDSLIEKIRQSNSFNQGFATTEYLAASYLDMAWHTLNATAIQDTSEFEKSVRESIDLIPEVSPRYHSTYFQHIFSGDGYAAGYYSYIWAEVLDADGYEAFKEKGLFDAETALSFRKNILEMGGTQDPMLLYKRFRGREPKEEILMRRRGLIE